MGWSFETCVEDFPICLVGDAPVLIAISLGSRKEGFFVFLVVSRSPGCLAGRARGPVSCYKLSAACSDNYGEPPLSFLLFSPASHRMDIPLF